MTSVSTILSSCLTMKNMGFGFFLLLMQLEGRLRGIQNKSFSSSWRSNWQMLLWIFLFIAENSAVCFHFYHSAVFPFIANRNCPGPTGLVVLQPTWQVPESCKPSSDRLPLVLSKHCFSDFLELTSAVVLSFRKISSLPPSIFDFWAFNKHLMLRKLLQSC